MGWDVRRGRRAVTPIRMAQYGTGHGHATGKLIALQRSVDVELAGVFEPDRARRAVLDRPGSAFHLVRWFADEAEMLDDPTIAAVASEGRNDESLAQTQAILRAGKHVWYDKPAGDDWAGWCHALALAREHQLFIQLGYMFRYHDGFSRIAAWAKTGLLGEIFSVRAHMSTSIPLDARQVIARHHGGIFYDLAGHMIDQIVWLLGRPTEVTAFFRQDGDKVTGFADNTLGVLAYARAFATIDIAAMEPPPPARRFEVYGSRGSAILEPFEPAAGIRLCLMEPVGEWAAGAQWVPVATQSRQELYERELCAFIATMRGVQPPDRDGGHELLVQETLLRVIGGISDQPCVSATCRGALEAGVRPNPRARGVRLAGRGGE